MLDAASVVVDCDVECVLGKGEGEGEVEVMREAKSQAGAFEQDEEGATSGSHMSFSAGRFTK